MAALHSKSLSRRCIPNQVFAGIYLCGLSALFCRHLLHSGGLPLPLRLFHLASDSILAFMWVTTQSFRVRPARRRQSIGTLLASVDPLDYPPLDIFVCTADPYKEPPISVVNTALSVMAYSYPPQKISVYLSDDAASPLTLFAFVQAAAFAAHWLPFCAHNNLAARSPEAFFSSSDHHCCYGTEKMKKMYEEMKEKVERVVTMGGIPDDEREGFEEWKSSKTFAKNNHPTVIKVLLESGRDADCEGNPLPNLVYLSREKMPTAPHHFKAGALNAMLRVSATMTNAPLILTVDCDMVSNDPQTAVRTLCYFLDPKLRPTLSYVQYPQVFNGLNRNDIYGGEFKRLFKINAMGMDGFNGPNYVGTGAFFQRRSLFGPPSSPVQPRAPELCPSHLPNRPISSPETVGLAHRVAGCDSEKDDPWGSEMGFRYGSLVEDFYTGYRLHCQGWRSVLCNPERAAFLGEMPTNLADAVSQCKRWAVGLSQILFSRHTPLASPLHPVSSLSYAHYTCWSLWSIPLAFYSSVPQLSLLHGRTAPAVLPEASDPWLLLHLFLFAGAYGQDLAEFLADGGTAGRWWSAQRMWMFRGLTCYPAGLAHYLLSASGLPAEGGFNVTSKAVPAEEERERYRQGVMDFGVASPMFVPLCSAAFLSLAAVLVQAWRTAAEGGGRPLSGEMMVAGAVVLNCLPVYGAALVRKDKGKMPLQVTAISAVLVVCTVYCSGALVGTTTH